jgi:hypothetical protein
MSNLKREFEPKLVGSLLREINDSNYRKQHGSEGLRVVESFMLRLL